MPPPASVHPVPVVVFLHQPEPLAVNATQSKTASPRAVYVLLGWYGIHRHPGRADLWCCVQSQRRCCQTCSVNSHSAVCLGSQSLQCAEAAGKMSWTLRCEGIAASAAHQHPAETRFSWRWDHNNTVFMQHSCCNIINAWYFFFLYTPSGSLQRVVAHYPQILTAPVKTIKHAVVFLREKCLFTVQQVTDILRDSPAVVLENTGQLEYKFQVSM